MKVKLRIKRILSGALALSLSMALTVPALAATSQTVAYNQGISLADAIQTVRNTVNSINQMKANGTVSDSKLSELAIQIGNLERAATGKEVTNELVQLVQDTEKAISGYGTSGAIKAQGALAILKMNLGITDTITVENKEAGSVTSFDDVPSSHWAYTDIMTIVNKGAIGGTKEPVNGVGHFDPSGTVSLGQFLAVATRLVASDKIAPQVKGEHWAMANYDAAIDSGLITRNDFMPSSLDTPISRQDMAFILVNVAKVNGETLEITPSIENNIKDYSKISQHREIAVKQAYSNGLLAGKTGGMFDPTGTTTRDQLATVFCRVMNYNPRPSVTVTETPTTSTETPLTNEKGQMNYDYAKKYIYDSMNTAKVYKENGKYFISCDLADLPEGFYWQPGADVYHATEGYKFYTDDSELGGSTGRLVIELVGVSEITDIAPVSFSLGIWTKENTMGTIYVNILSSYPNKINETQKSGRDAWVDYDTSAIFKGIGK